MAEGKGWSRVLSIVISALAFVMGVYHLVYSQWLLQDPLMHQNTHLAFALLLVFLTTLGKKPNLWPYIFCFILLSLIGVLYVQINYVELAERAGIPTTRDIIIGTIAVVMAHSMMGEITPRMAEAIASSPAQKILIPLSQENVEVVGVSYVPLPHLVETLIEENLNL